MRDENIDCGTCGQRVAPLEYHPFLYCELYKLGHRDQAAYLRLYGFERVPEHVDLSQASEDGGDG